MKGGTKNCQKGSRRVCVPINRQAEVIQLLKNPPGRINKTVPNELGAFNEVLKQVRREHPNLSYRDAQKLASQVYRDARASPVDESRSFDTTSESVANSIIDESRSFDTTSESVANSITDESRTFDTTEEVGSETESVNSPAVEELTSLEELATKLGLNVQLKEVTKDVAHFDEKAKLIDDLLDDFYEVEYGEKINIQEALKEMSKDESRSFFDDMLDILDDISDTFIKEYEKKINDDLSYEDVSYMLKDSQNPVQSYDDLYDEFFVSGEGLELIRKAVKSIHRSKRKRGGDSQTLVEDDNKLLEYLNSNYDGLPKLIDDLRTSLESSPGLDVKKASMLYNAYLELEDLHDTLESVLEQVQGNDLPRDYLCPIYIARYEDVPELLGSVRSAFTDLKRRFPDIMEIIKNYAKCNGDGFKLYNDNLGEPRGGNFWGNAGKYAPNYYHHSRPIKIRPRY